MITVYQIKERDSVGYLGRDIATVDSIETAKYFVAKFCGVDITQVAIDGLYRMYVNDTDLFMTIVDRQIYTPADIDRIM